MKNLDKYLNHELKLPVDIFNPFLHIAGGSSVPESVAPQLTVAIGLAMRRENDVPKR
jgi:Tfp pilus assembly PilM family ATPase